MSELQNWLRLQLGADGLPLDADGFLEIFRATMESLKALDRTLSTHGSETLQWRITEAGTNSPLHTTLAGVPLTGSPNGHGDHVVDTFSAGLYHLNSARTSPPSFGIEVLQHIKAFGVCAKRHRLAPVVSTAGKTVRIADVLAANATWASRALEAKARYLKEYGALEGILKELRAATRGGDRVVLVDRATGDETLCILAREELEDIARRTWKKRVSIEGTIYIDRHTQKPAKIKVDNIVQLRERAELTQVDDLQGIDITGGVDSAEYVQGLYNDE